MKNGSLLLATLMASLLLPSCRQGASPGATSPGAGSTSAAAPAGPTGTPLPDSAFRVEWGKPQLPEKMTAGHTYPVKVAVKNTSTTAWPDPATASKEQNGAFAVRLSYRWWPRDHSAPVAPYSARADFSKTLPPGASETMTIEVAAPSKPGSYSLQLDLVQELNSWFEDKGAARLEVTVKVE